MTDRIITREVTRTRFITRSESPTRIITSNLGLPGDDGDPGDSAYAVAVANGFVGSEQDWLDSLVGPAGDDADVGPETAARIAADAVLAAADATEAAARIAGDATNASAVSTEATARATADALLIPLSQKGAANGVPTLDVTAHIPLSQLPAAVLGALNYQGTWNATSNTPTIPAAASGNKGYYYRVATAGSTVVDGVNDWKVGDWIVSDGTIWQKVDNTDPASVSDVPGLVTALGLKADQSALDSEETDRIAGDATLQAEIDALPSGVSRGATGWFNGDEVPSAHSYGYVYGRHGDYYVQRSTGDIYRKEWVKPPPWAWAIVDLAPEFQPIATKALFLALLLEGSDPPFDLISGEQGVALGGLHPTPAWTTRDGLICKDGSVGGHWQWDSPPLAAMDQPLSFLHIEQNSSFINLAKINVESWGDQLGGGIDPYYGTTPDTYQPSNAYAGLYTSTGVPPTEPSHGPGWHAHVNTLVSRGVAGAWAIDGQPTATPSNLDDGTLLSEMALAPTTFPLHVGSSDDENSTDPTWFQAGWGVFSELTQEEAELVTSDPFGVVWPAAYMSPKTQWVRILEGATQAELDAINTALGDRATALEAVAPTANQKLALVGTGTPSGTDKYVNNSDARMTDARTPTAHVHPESEVTNLVTDLAGKQSLATNLTAIAALVGASDRLAYFTGVGTLSLATFTAFGRTLAALADAAAGRTALALVPGTDVQAFHANLAAFAGLTLIADRLPYANGSGTLALATLSSFIRTLLDDADAATAIATLGAVATGDSRLSDSRAPNGSASGDLAGSYPSPTVAKLHETSGPTALTLGAVADGEVLTRVGSTVVGSTPGAVPADNSITNAKLADMATATIKGRSTAGTGDPEDLTTTQVRTLLALVIGTNVQAWNAKLDTLAALTWAADKGLYFTSASAASTFDLSGFGRSLVDDADATTARATLGLAALAILATVGTAQIDNDAVTYAKLQNISATARLLGRVTAGAGDAEEIPLGTGLAFSAGALACTVTAPSAATASVLGTVKIVGTPTDAANPAVLVQEESGLRWGRRFASSQYYDPGGISNSSGNLTSTQSAAVPFYVGKTTTFDRIAIQVTTGTATSVVRLAIYSDNAGYPGARVYDGSTIDASTTGIKTLTMSVQLAPGLYWLTAQAETANAVVARMSTSFSSYLMPQDATDFTLYRVGYVKNGGLGASNPDPWYASATPSTNAPRLMLRAA